MAELRDFKVNVELEYSVESTVEGETPWEQADIERDYILDEIERIIDTLPHSVRITVKPVTRKANNDEGISTTG
jgi:hypothetical protein